MILSFRSPKNRGKKNSSRTAPAASATTFPCWVKIVAYWPVKGCKARRSLDNIPWRKERRSGPVNCSNPRRDKSTKPALERAAVYSPAGSPKWAGNSQSSRSAKTAPFDRCNSINDRLFGHLSKIYRLDARLTTRKGATLLLSSLNKFSGVIKQVLQSKLDRRFAWQI